MEFYILPVILRYKDQDLLTFCELLMECFKGQVIIGHIKHVSVSITINIHLTDVSVTKTAMHLVTKGLFPL